MKDTRKKLIMTGIFKDQAESMMYLLGKAIKNRSTPVGSWTLKMDLDNQGVNCSTATIGRYLKLLDSKGYTLLRGNQGRVLTPSGAAWINYLDEQLERIKIRNNAASSIHISEYTELVDLMQVRKLIETEAARLAAENATVEEINHLYDTLTMHQKYVEENMDPVDPALDFHMAVAQCSHNKFIIAILSLLVVEEKKIEETIEVLCTRELGGSYVVDHENIASAIRNRDPVEAAELMDIHMGEIVSAVEKQISELKESGITPII